ncbi:MAG: complex I NDUFA9 subunit family protein [Burkholderiaceae bacterium]
MRHKNILVLGGSGFLGSALVGTLSGQGRRVRVPSRRYEEGRHLLLLPTVELVKADVNEPGAFAPLLEGIDAVVNLVGVLHGGRAQPYGPGFAQAHVEIPRMLADAARAAGVRRLLHVSALGVTDADPAGLPSMYLRSKAAGEQVIRGTRDIDWTIFRPSIVYGSEDRFTRLFARMARYLPIIPLARGDAQMQPIWVGDVARAIAATIDAPWANGRCFELAGPEVTTLGAIVEDVVRWSGRRRLVWNLPDDIGRLQATALEFAPGPTLMTRDNFDSLGVPNIASGPMAPELRLEPVAMSGVAPEYLVEDDVLYISRRARAGR